MPPLDSDRRQEVEELFRAADVNHDALIDYREFVRLVGDLDSGIERETLKIGFESVDTDRDGQIDLAEFLEWWAER